VKQVFKEILQGKERPPQSSEPPFKEKEKGGGRIPCLVVKEDPLLGGQRRSLAWWSKKIPCLVVNEDPLFSGQ
jgi:hypothetical protein